MLDSGGWIPSVDHSVPHDVSLGNYRYYLDLTREYMSQAASRRERSNASEW